MLTMLLCAAMALALVVPETMIGRFLRALLIELPVRMLSALTPARIIFGLFLVLIIAGLIALAKNDGLMITAMSFPEGFAWFAAFDLTAYIDLIGAALLIASAVRFRAAFRALRSAAARARHRAALSVATVRERLRSGARDRSARGRRKASPPPRDEPDWPALAFQ